MRTMVSFDIMLNGRYVKTMHLPLCSEPSFIGSESMTDVIDCESIREEVEQRLPTLRNKKFKIAF